MTSLLRRLGSAAGVLAAGVAVATLASTPAVAADDAAAARAATAGYHNIDKALADGFGKLVDKHGIACIDNPAGGMGIHYVLGSRVGNASEVAGEPEVLVYEPQKNGQLRLVAVEYVVLQSTWLGAGHSVSEPPRLFDTDFELVPEGNRYDLPAFYELHAWVWKNNPSGMNEDWNPTVSCNA